MFDDTPPEWWQTVEAARYLKVAPWDLEKQPIYWTDRAIMAMNATHDATAEKRANGAEREVIAAAGGSDPETW